MKTINKNAGKVLLLILLFNMQIAKPVKADFFEIDISEQSICFADHAKWGKISVFIISTHFCPPCIALKKRILMDYSDNQNVDIYYCFLTKDAFDKRYQSRESFKIWQQIDLATKVYPTVYLFSSTRNLFSFYQGYNEEKYAELSQSINYLLDKTTEYFDMAFINGIQPLANANLLQNLRKEIDDLRKVLTKVEENEIGDKNETLANESRQPLTGPYELERLKISQIESPNTPQLQLTNKKTTNHLKVETSKHKKWIFW